MYNVVINSKGYYMKKILLIPSILLLNSVSAATLTTDKPRYTTTDTIKINFKEMINHHKDWIGVYPASSSTAWKNVLKWAWTQNKSDGTLTFKNLPAGHYEVRGFYNNSYDIEARKDFWVNPSNHPGTKAELSATKAIFKTDEDVRINFKNINGATNDWLAIYPADKNNDWGNVVKWKFNRGGVKQGQANFDRLPAGKYEARIFYNNTFKMEGKVAFRVEGVVGGGEAPEIYAQGQFIPQERINFGLNGFHKNTKDWVAIYPKGSSNAWGNVIDWQFVEDPKKEITFNKLPVGEYEIRGFFNNSFKLETSFAFRVGKAKQRFFTQNKKYSFAYIDTYYTLNTLAVEWFVIDNNNKVTDQRLSRYTVHTHRTFGKLKGADIFTIKEASSMYTNYYFINNEGKLTSLGLTKPNAGGRIESHGEKVIHENGKTKLETTYNVYEEHKIYTYVHDVTDLNHVVFLSKSFEEGNW